MVLDFYGCNKGNKVVPEPVENPDNTIYLQNWNYENGVRKPDPENIPEQVGLWKLVGCSGTKGNESLHYIRSNPYVHCVVQKVKNDYRISMGISRPAGCEIRHNNVDTLEEAFKDMEVYNMDKLFKRFYGKQRSDKRFKNQFALEKPLYGILSWGIVKTSEEKFEALKNEIVRDRFDYDESSCTPDGILITNLSRADVQYFAEHFGKRDFIYGERTLSENTGYYQLDMEFWEYEETAKYNITTHSTSVTEYLDIYEDKTEKIDDFMVRHYFSFSDSFANVLNSASRNIFQKYSWKEPRQFLREVETYLTEHDKYTGLAQWRYRARMLHKPQSWELEDGTRNAYYEMWIKNQTQN